MQQPSLSLVPGAAPTGPPSPPRPRIGEVLTARGLVTEAQLAACLRRQRRMDARLGPLLRSDAGLGEEDILAALESQWRARRIDLARSPPDPALIDRVGLDHCLATRCVPWRRIGAATVIAAVYPDRFEALRARYEEAFGPVMLALVTEADLADSLARVLPDATRQRSEARVPSCDSCRGWTGHGLQSAALAGGALLALTVAVAPLAAFVALNALALVALVAVTLLKAAAVLAAYAPPRRRKPPARDNVLPMARTGPGRMPVVSLIVPLYREEAIAERLVARLGGLAYPKPLLDICLVVEAHDTQTRALLARTALPAEMRVIIVPAGTVKTKPRALNFGLDHCRGSIVGVYDAEDAPAPGQIDAVVRHFAEAAPEVACVQGRLSFYNPRQNWLARCFTIDYAIWFAMILPGVARLGLPIPLGGTSLFFRRDVLDELGAWDAHNVTEDADLGIRLARRGYRTELIASTTLEEANARLWPWIRQRSRWLKGYAMTYATHMRRPRRLWRELGARGFAGFQAMFLGTLLQTLLAPVLWSWWLVALTDAHPLSGHLPPGVFLSVTGLLVFSEALNLAVAALALRRTGRRWLIPWTLTLNGYFMLTSVAILKALAEMALKPFYWDKTDHGLAPGPAEAPAPSPAAPA